MSKTDVKIIAGSCACCSSITIITDVEWCNCFVQGMICWGAVDANLRTITDGSGMINITWYVRKDGCVGMCQTISIVLLDRLKHYVHAVNDIRHLDMTSHNNSLPYHLLPGIFGEKHIDNMQHHFAGRRAYYGWSNRVYQMYEYVNMSEKLLCHVQQNNNLSRWQL